MAVSKTAIDYVSVATKVNLLSYIIHLHISNFV